MHNWKTLTDEEIAAQRNTIVDGTYPFHVISAKSGYSKTSNNPQVVILLKFLTTEGREFLCTFYLVLTESFSSTIKDFWSSVAMPEKYEEGHAEDYEYVGKMGYARIKMEKEQNGDRMFARVKQFVVKKDNDKVCVEKPKDDEDVFDDLPF